MSKAIKSINVEISDAKDPQGNDISELRIGRTRIGTIKKIADNKFETINTHQESYHVKTFDEGVQLLIKDFHLHH